MNPQLASGKLTKKTLHHIHWIGLRKKQTGKPNISWGKQWFPVKIFPEKPIH